MMPHISSLTVFAVVIGSMIVAFSLAGMMFPAVIKSWALAFPRNTMAGRVLAAIDIMLVAVLLLTEGFAWVDAHSHWVYLAVPVSFFIAVYTLDELLAVRTLGGLFLLVPFWILKIAFMHPAAAKLYMTAFAYLVVAAGMALMWSPYLFHKLVKNIVAHPLLGRAAGICASIAGVAMIVLGLAVY